MEAERRERMNEILFLVEEASEGGFTARSLSDSIYTEAADVQALQAKVKDAVACHFEGKKSPQKIRLHFVRDEVIHL